MEMDVTITAFLNFVEIKKPMLMKSVTMEIKLELTIARITVLLQNAVITQSPLSHFE